VANRPSVPVVLDFDHVRGTKHMNVKRMLAGTYSLDRIFQEIEKCEVRCANCHRRVTAARSGFYAYLAADPPPLPSGQYKSPCGTRGAYQRGCRCDACREAQRVASANYRKYGSYSGPPSAVAQIGPEQRTHNPKIVGSNPTRATM
jgi:hypothetical protein